MLPLRRGFFVLYSLVLALLPVLAQAGRVAIGTDMGGQALVKVYETPGTSPIRSFVAYPPSFNGGVRVAVGDVTGDGVPDVITGPGPGVGANVKVFDGVSGAEARSFLAYDPIFTGGVYVASADIDGDGSADIITGTDEGSAGGARVKVFSGTNLSVLADFLPYGVAFNGGVRVATGDVNGDGVPDIITGT